MATVELRSMLEKEKRKADIFVVKQFKLLRAG